MISKKTPEEFDRMRRGGKILAQILTQLEQMVKPGVRTDELNDEALRLMDEHGAEPVLLGYHPEFAPRPYPAAICTSVNNVIVHGVPTEHPITLREGDIIGIDCTLAYEGMIVDSARTVPVGHIDEKAALLLRVTKEARDVGIAAAQVGNTIGDIGYAIQEYIKPYKFGIVEELSGHGVGYAVHEPPFVPNYGKKGQGERIEVGMAFAIEPMVNEGSKRVVFDEVGGYMVETEDGSRSAHFEHTVIITEQGPEVVTA